MPAQRIVVSNPGTYIFPTRNAEYPFGFGGLPEQLSSDDALRHYLAQPITLYLGQRDTERNEHFSTVPAAERQGKTRWERGQNAFRAASWPSGAAGPSPGVWSSCPTSGTITRQCSITGSVPMPCSAPAKKARREIRAPA